METGAVPGYIHINNPSLTRVQGGFASALCIIDKLLYGSGLERVLHDRTTNPLKPITNGGL
jgi:hypothetical protein